MALTDEELVHQVLTGNPSDVERDLAGRLERALENEAVYRAAFAQIRKAVFLDDMARVAEVIETIDLDL